MNRIDIPSRRPAYDKKYPTDSAITAAIETRSVVGSLLTSDVKEVAVRRSSADAALLSVEGLRAGGRHDPFALRTVGGAVCDVLRTRIVPDVHGKVDDILLTVPPYVDDDGRPNPAEPVAPYVERHQRRLVTLLGPGRKFTVVCQHYQRNRVKEWFAAVGVPSEDVRLVLSVFDYSIWAQDAYVALAASSVGPVLCEGVLFPRYDDMSIADDVAAQFPVSTLQSILYFQGGNVLGGPERTLIGKDYVWQNTGRANLETEARVLDGFSRLFGTPVVSIGRAEAIPLAARSKGLSGIFQPIFHIDMYVTPTGVTGRSGREIALVGRPAKARAILGQSAGPLDFDRYFAEAEEQLSEIYEVRELPLLPEYGDLGGAAPEARYYHLTYNNALVENYAEPSGQRRIVYMPTFAQDARQFGLDRAVRETLDDAAAEIWTGAGFEVRRMDGVEDLAYGAGSVHCITKALRRSGFAPNVVPG